MIVGIRLSILIVVGITLPVIKIGCINVIDGNTRVRHFAEHQFDGTCAEFGRQFRNEMLIENAMFEFRKPRNQHPDIAALFIEFDRQRSGDICQTAGFQ